MADGEALRHLKTVVVLFVLASVVACFIGFVLLGRWPVVGTMALLFGATSALVAAGLRQKCKRSRQVACVLAIMSVPVLPVGTAFGLYVLRVVGTNRGKRLFNDPGALIHVRPFASIIAAQVALASCVVWASLVFGAIALPMLVKAHAVNAAFETQPGTEETRHQPQTRAR